MKSFRLKGLGFFVQIPLTKGGFEPGSRKTLIPKGERGYGARVGAGSLAIPAREVEHQDQQVQEDVDAAQDPHGADV